MTRESELHQSSGLFTQLVNPQTGETVTFHFEAGQETLPIDVVMPDRTIRARLRPVRTMSDTEYDVWLHLEPPSDKDAPAKPAYVGREPTLVSAQLAKDPESPATATGSQVNESRTYLPRESKLIAERLAKDPSEAATASAPQAPPPPTREQNPYSVFAPMETPKAEPGAVNPTAMAVPGGEAHPQSVFGPAETTTPAPVEGSGGSTEGGEGKESGKVPEAPAKPAAATPAKGSGGKSRG